MRRAALCAGAVLLVAMLCASCSGETARPATPSPTSEQLVVKLTTAHFQVLADRTETGVVQEVASALEAAYPRVTRDLRTGDLPTVSAWVWADAASFYAAMGSRLGTVYQGSTGYVFGRSDLAILASAHSGRTACHEFVHVASMALNPAIPNNPRWLWETVALFLNGEFVDPATLDYMRAGRYPTIAALDSSYDAGRQVYEVGYLLGEFIAATWGMDGLIRLVQSNGNVPATLGVAVSELEQRWYDYLRVKYGLP